MWGDREGGGEWVVEIECRSARQVGRVSLDIKMGFVVRVLQDLGQRNIRKYNGKR